MQTIASRLLLSIGAVATALFIAAFIVVDLVKQNLAEDAIKEFRAAGQAYFQTRLNEKLSSGTASAVALANSPQLRYLIANQEHEQLATVLSAISKSFAQATEYKNIQFLILNGQGQFLYRSYVKEPDSGRGKDATYRAGVKDILSGAKFTLRD